MTEGKNGQSANPFDPVTNDNFGSNFHYDSRRRRPKVKKQTNPGKWYFFTIVVFVTFLISFFARTIPSFGSSLYNWFGGLNDVAAVAQKIQSSTRIHVINVGQGSSILIEQDGFFALVDAGPPENKDFLIAYMQGIPIKKLKYVIMTHPHSDHIGGMKAVIETFSVEKVLLPDFSLTPTPTTPFLQYFLETLSEYGVPAETITTDNTYPLGQGMIYALSAGLESNGENLDATYNLLSPILLFEAKGMRLLSSGDAEKPNEDVLLESGVDLHADVYIAGHHGSSTSNSYYFVKKINPSFVAISCSGDNPHGHPHRAAMEAFTSVNATVLRTDQNGSIVFGLDNGGDIIYSTEKTME